MKRKEGYYWIKYEGPTGDLPQGWQISKFCYVENKPYWNFMGTWTHYTVENPNFEIKEKIIELG